MVVKVMFKKPQGDKRPEIENLNWKQCLENIDKKDYNCLFEDKYKHCYWSWYRCLVNYENLS